MKCENCGHDKEDHSRHDVFCIYCECEKFTPKNQGCGKYINKEDRTCGDSYSYYEKEKRPYIKKKTDYGIWLCKRCKKNHSPVVSLLKDKEPEDLPTPSRLSSESGSFNLSDKIDSCLTTTNRFHKFIRVKDVKEFIRRLKDKIVQVEDGIALVDPKAVDKLAGGKLV